MPVKIKINWDNENVVSESVRIYRADSTFTSADLPPLLSEIFGDIYEFEDLDIIQGQTYFYMLSAKLGEEEVFTDCFNVLAKVAKGFPIITSISFEQIIKSQSLSATFYSKEGDYIYVHNASVTSRVEFAQHATINEFGDYSESATVIILLPAVNAAYVYASFFNEGMGLCVIAGSSGAYKRYIFELIEAYAIETATLKSDVIISSSDRAQIVENQYIKSGLGTISFAPIVGDIFSSYTLGSASIYTVPTDFTYCFDVSANGKSIVLISGNRTTNQEKRIVSLSSDVAFNYSSPTVQVVDRGTALDKTRANNTNRFLYDGFMLLYNADNNSLLKTYFTEI